MQLAVFGLLDSPCRRCFTEENRLEYQAHFCGLSHALRSDYGHWARLLTNRDAVFLSILTRGFSLGEPSLETRSCCVPWKKKTLLSTDPAQRLLAAGVMLAFAAHAEDDAEDCRGYRGMGAAVATRCLRSAKNQALQLAESLGVNWHITWDHLRKQRQWELAFDGASNSLHSLASPTAAAYADFFGGVAVTAGGDAASIEGSSEARMSVMPAD